MRVVPNFLIGLLLGLFLLAGLSAASLRALAWPETEAAARAVLPIQVQEIADEWEAYKILHPSGCLPDFYTTTVYLGSASGLEYGEEVPSQLYVGKTWTFGDDGWGCAVVF